MVWVILHEIDFDLDEVLTHDYFWVNFSRFSSAFWPTFLIFNFSLNLFLIWRLNFLVNLLTCQLIRAHLAICHDILLEYAVICAFWVWVWRDDYWGARIALYVDAWSNAKWDQWVTTRICVSSGFWQMIDTELQLIRSLSLRQDDHCLR